MSTIRDYTFDLLVNFMDEDEAKAFNIWNSEMRKINCEDDLVYYMDEFDDLFSCESPSSIVELVQGCDFQTCDDYFKFDGWGDIESSDYLSDLIDWDDVVDNYSDDDEDEEWTWKHFYEEYDLVYPTEEKLKAYEDARAE